MNRSGDDNSGGGSSFVAAGVGAKVFSLVATARWEKTGVQGKSDAAEIWRRFPKFVLGFLAASAIITLVSKGYDYATYKKDVLPGLVAPLQALRTWAFTFAFLSIGLTTKIREFASVGARPFYAFTLGVAGTVNGKARIVVVGVCMRTDHIEPFVAVAKQLEIRFSFGYSAAEFEATLNRISSGGLPLDELITDIVDLDGAPGAFKALADPGDHGKVLVRH